MHILIADMAPHWSSGQPTKGLPLLHSSYSSTQTSQCEWFPLSFIFTLIFPTRSILTGANTVGPSLSEKKKKGSKTILKKVLFFFNLGNIYYYTRKYFYHNNTFRSYFPQYYSDFWTWSSAFYLTALRCVSVTRAYVAGLMKAPLIDLECSFERLVHCPVWQQQMCDYLVLSMLQSPNWSEL